MEFLVAHGDTIAILIALGGLAWKASAKIAHLESSVTILSGKLESVQHELTEFKSESKRNFTRLYERVDEISERVAKLEGRAER